MEAFDHRADTYDRGPIGDWHRAVAERAADLALAQAYRPSRILDVGCGTGMLLRRLALSLPDDVLLAGVDPALRMVARAREAVGRATVVQAAAEKLPYADGSFDLVVSTMSFDHWADQRVGLLECARVLESDGRFVLTDLFAAWLGTRRTMRRTSALLSAAGLRPLSWHRVYGFGPVPLVRAVVACKASSSKTTFAAASAVG